MNKKNRGHRLTYLPTCSHFLHTESPRCGFASLGMAQWKTQGHHYHLHRFVDWWNIREGAVQNYRLQEDSLMIEEPVANNFSSSKCVHLKTGTVPVFTWHGTVSSLAWHCVQPETPFGQPGAQFVQPKNRRKCVAR